MRGAEVEWCGVIRNLEYPGRFGMVVVDVLHELIVDLMWWAESMGQRWEGHMGWVHEHCGLWRFAGRCDETDTGCVVERWGFECGSYSGEVAQSG
jgi:hypothetical protein